MAHEEKPHFISQGKYEAGIRNEVMRLVPAEFGVHTLTVAGVVQSDHRYWKGRVDKKRPTAEAEVAAHARANIFVRILVVFGGLAVSGFAAYTLISLPVIGMGMSTFAVAGAALVLVGLVGGGVHFALKGAFPNF